LENYEKEQSEMSAEEKAEESTLTCSRCADDAHSSGFAAESFKDHNVRHVDPVTSTFHTRISYAPEQILRFVCQPGAHAEGLV
jgi:hypothetical protein